MLSDRTTRARRSLSALRGKPRNVRSKHALFENLESRLLMTTTPVTSVTLISRDPSSHFALPADSTVIAISSDGRYSFFQTAAVASSSDHNTTTDLYRYDRTTGAVILASDGLAGGNDRNFSVSDDGNLVAFTTDASLLSNDLFSNDVYVKNLSTGAYTLISIGSGGNSVGGDFATISGNGAAVVFQSTSAAVISGEVDTHSSASNIYVRNLGASSTLLASRSNWSPTTTADASSYNATISDDGNTVAYVSQADDIIFAGVDNNAAPDVYTFKLSTGMTINTSLFVAASMPTSGGGHDIQLSDNGLRIAYLSTDKQLFVADTTNPSYENNKATGSKTGTVESTTIVLSTFFDRAFVDGFALSGNGNFVGVQVDKDPSIVTIWNHATFRDDITAIGILPPTTYPTTFIDSSEPAISDSDISITTDGSRIAYGKGAAYVWDATAGAGLVSFNSTGTAVPSGFSNVNDTLISKNGSYITFDTPDVAAPFDAGHIQTYLAHYAPSNLPIGSLDVAHASEVTGWAFDADAGASPVTVRVDIDGHIGTPVTANNSRPDLAGLGSINHGFDFNPISGYELSVGSHTAAFYIYDANGDPEWMGNFTITNAPPAGVISTVSASTVTGYAYDPDAATNGTSPISVDLVVDGVVVPGSTQTAYLPSADVGYGSAHGFSFDLNALGVPLAPGDHTIQVRAHDYQNPSATPVVIATQAFTNQAPLGGISTITNSTVTGWTADPDNASAALNVDLYVNGVAVATNIPANFSTADVGYGTNHGFSLSIPASSLHIGTNNIISIMAHDSEDPASLTEVAETTVTDSAPTTVIETHTTSTVSGYAYDTDGPSGGTTSLTVDLVINNVVRSTQTASISRPDISGLGFGTAHGFSFDLASLGITFPPGTYTIAIRAHDGGNPSSTADTSTSPITNATPTAVITSAGTTNITGYAYDPDASGSGSSPITVDLKIDNVVRATVTANLASSDVGYGAFHGFSIDIPAIYMTPGTHTLTIVPHDSQVTTATGTTASQTVPGDTLPVVVIDAGTDPNVITGYAYDPDGPSGGTGSLTVDLLFHDPATGDILKVSGVTANLSRPDISGLGFGTAHGFSIAIPTGAYMSAGTHAFKVQAHDSQFTSSVTVSSSHNVVNTAPTGFVDGANAGAIAGWALDTDAPSGGTAPSVVTIYIDSIDGSHILFNNYATGSRPDVDAIYHTGANHGFSVLLTNALNTIGHHTLYVYTYDAQSLAPLLISTNSYTNSAPTGNIDAINSTGIVGWTLDGDGANNGTGSLPVQFYYDSVDSSHIIAGVTANVTRSDLSSLGHGTAHGYSYTWAGALPHGTHTIYVYTFDSESGQAVLLASRVVTF